MYRVRLKITRHFRNISLGHFSIVFQMSKARDVSKFVEYETIKPYFVAYKIMKWQLLFSRYALAIHDMLHYLAWIVIIKMCYSVRTCFLFLYFFLPYSSGHLTTKLHGYFRCPGNKINAVCMWFVVYCMI